MVTRRRTWKMKFSKAGIINEPGNSETNKTGGWRTQRPEIDYNKCTKCGICWVFCPDGAIKKINDKFVINYNYCKGCGICAKECPFKAINMKEEEK